MSWRSKVETSSVFDVLRFWVDYAPSAMELGSRVELSSVQSRQSSASSSWLPDQENLDPPLQNHPAILFLWLERSLVLFSLESYSKWVFHGIFSRQVHLSPNVFNGKMLIVVVQTLIFVSFSHFGLPNRHWAVDFVFEGLLRRNLFPQRIRSRALAFFSVGILTSLASMF